MSRLTQAQLAELREDLESERVLLERRVARAAAVGRPVELDQTSVGRLSRMDALQNQGLAAGAQARAQIELVQVLDALSRIDAGTYGYCHGCQQPIGYERLSVMPEARDCAACSRRS